MIQKLHEKTPLAAQLDFSATPRFQKGAIFPWTISDYPLKQAILDGIVKRPMKGIAKVEEAKSEHASVIKPSTSSGQAKLFHGRYRDAGEGARATRNAERSEGPYPHKPSTTSTVMLSEGECPSRNIPTPMDSPPCRWEFQEENSLGRLSGTQGAGVPRLAGRCTSASGPLRWG